MEGVTRYKDHLRDNCRRRLIRVSAAVMLYFAVVFACQAQLANDSPAGSKEQQAAPPVSKPPAVQSPTGAQPPATQQAPLGSEDAAGAQQPPTGTQPAPPPDPQDARLDIYGFAMLDTGYNFGAINPDWFDVVRPTQLPSFKNEFGKNGNWFAGVRQTRFGVKGFIPTRHGEIKTIFEFELFGTGVDAGQTTFRLRHAYGEFHKIGAGQTWSVFMDPDVFPNTIEYWGPNGMVFFRNVQLRYTPWSSGDSNFAVALERPGASGDGGIYADRIELQNIKPRFRFPDLTSHLRLAGKWGHIQIAGLLRDIKWDDLLPNDQFNLDGGVIGWGVNVSSNIKFRKKDVIRLQAAYGDGMENYMNDAPVDVAVANNLSNPLKPVIGKALPVLGIVAFYDHTWSDKFTSSIGYSLVDIQNTSAQLPSDFKRGQYAVTNLLYYPVKGVMTGGELQWGRRSNRSDGFIYNDYRIQFSFKYDFAFTLKR
jgi:DcaP outer membrane protein